MLEVGTGFHPELTGRENIYMNGAILGMTRAEISGKMEQIIDFSECREFIDTPVKRYSSGMYVKLAFSVAAHLDSEIMIMDEVLAVGDMKFQQKCLNRMGDAASQEGRTVLYVSHNMSTIRQFCTRCIVLDKGRIIFDGDVEPAIDVYTEVAIDRTRTFFDISQKFQRYLSPVPRAKMQTVQLVGKENALYDLNEPVIFDLAVKARERVESASLRFEVRASDESSVGTAFALNFGMLEKGESRWRFTMHTEGLVPGKYNIVLGLFEVNRAGAYNDFDVVERAMGFEITDTDERLGINWLGGFWGHLRFTDLLPVRQD
jgi:lipopolysaccharide transport system ATP-binding protein